MIVPDIVLKKDAPTTPAEWTIVFFSLNNEK